ncbi:MAG: hypothetical protein IKR07_05105 [Oscillospiraceae bacterium]|nr:hypothetical protein [Oscillospiraceae bacterium]
MSTVRRAIRMLAMLAVLYVLTACLSAFAPDRFLLRMPTTFCLMGLSLGLQLYFSARVIDPGVRRCLTAVAGMICFWFILRGAKYIAFEESERIARHIWYLYYLPILSIPLLSLFAAISAGTVRAPKTVRCGMAVAVVITAVLAVLVLTNDLHQLMFVFRPGFERWDSDYVHGNLFILIYLWTGMLLLALFGVLLRRCRLSESRRLVWVPLIPVAFGITYLVLYTLDLWPSVNGSLFGEFPESVAFTMAGVWLSLIRIGLIPSNEGYETLFEASSLSAQIADGARHVIFRSDGAATLTPEQLGQGGTVLLDANTRLHCRAVHGGWVYWQDDVSSLNRINDELEETKEQLAEEAELLRLRNELEQERMRIEERLRVYDEISAAVMPQAETIETLCEKAKQTPETYDAGMKTVCLLGAYIKRYANLSLLAADSAEIEIEEPYLAVAESLRQIGRMGVPTFSAPPEKASVPAECAKAVYARFEGLLESSLPVLCGAYAVFTADALKLTLEGAALQVPEAYVEDSCTYVRIPLSKGGGDA